MRNYKEDDEQMEYLTEWARKKKVRDEEKANKKQRQKEARRCRWKRK
ncbi:MAG: hypothetical protein IKF75_00765 [Lachnospiraceae bacterium]|nr:hypothetical protein [Lachnospiraceae bacterium]MBR3231186.1 hypothetical protein [Lachnospiraceae bacterium]